MVLSWCLLIPLGILVARFFKVTPGQRWPDQLDNKFWWRAHLRLQYGAVALMWLALGFAWRNAASVTAATRVHALLGWTVIALASLQVLEGLLRGSKGGPPQMDLPMVPGSGLGDHYDMSTRRVIFEYAHKLGGYLVLAVSAATVCLGLRLADAPRWMFVVIGFSWAIWIAAFAVLQRRRLCFDTYQAIWGPGLEHPGNRRKPIGLGIRRHGD